MTEKALLLAGSEEEGNIFSKIISEKQRLGLQSLLSVRSVTVFLLSVLLMIILILYVQLEVLQSDRTLTILPSPQPNGGSGGSWLRNMHGEYRLVSPTTTKQGYNFSEAAAVCQSLHAHLPFIENKDEERELVVSSELSTGPASLKSDINYASM